MQDGLAQVSVSRRDCANVDFMPLGPDAIVASMRQYAHIVLDPNRNAVGVALADIPSTHGDIGTDPFRGFALQSVLGPLYPEWLGDRAFTHAHGLRFAYLGGSMARGIASAELAVALAEIGAMGMFGAAGMAPHQIDAAIDVMRSALDVRGLPWGCNLIHSPNEPDLEDAIVDLYLRREVRRVEASAYIRLTTAVVRYACSGLHLDAQGKVQRRNHVFAKVSREEVARQFLSPAPAIMLQQLVAAHHLTSEEAQLAAQLPLAEQIIVEADSGGHTDNRPLPALFPVIARLRDDIAAQYGYTRPIFIGAAGGLGTPEALASAFALGAAFVVIGSVHQACIESGMSEDGRMLLAQAGPADVAMTASADMFEMGVKVQVLTRGTMMAARGNQLFDLYRRYASIDEIPANVRLNLETTIFRASLQHIWQETETFFAGDDPGQLERAAREPKHKLALLLRWYIGHSSRWPLVGERNRQADYQIWCGPAMGGFNRWVAGSFLEPPEARSVRQVALNLLEGAAVITRAQQYRTYGLPVSARAFSYRPAKLRVA